MNFAIKEKVVNFSIFVLLFQFTSFLYKFFLLISVLNYSNWNIANYSPKSFTLSFGSDNLSPLF